jgi:hypothetical protein
MKKKKQKIKSVNIATVGGPRKAKPCRIALFGPLCGPKSATWQEKERPAPAASRRSWPKTPNA